VSPCQPTNSCDLSSTCAHSEHPRLTKSLNSIVATEGILMTHIQFCIVSSPPSPGSSANTAISCLYVCPLAYLKNHKFKLHKFLSMLPMDVARSPLTTMQYVVHFRFCGLCHVFTQRGNDIWLTQAHLESDL